MMKRILTISLLCSLFANVGLFWFAKEQYKNANAIRLDPLQLSYFEQVPLPMQSGKHRVVFYGDSRALSWPAPDIENIQFINRGIGNQTSEQIRLRYDSHILPLQADILIVQLCVNDLKTIPLFPQNRVRIVEQCQHNLQEIISKAEVAGAKVILTTVFPVGKVSPERYLVWSDEVRLAIREINHFIKKLANDNVIVWDTYALLEGKKNRIRTEYSRDLLHLNQQGYEVLNQHLKELIKVNLK